MSLSYGFFNAELDGSGQYDRVYAAEQFAEYFHLFIKNGVFPTPATNLQVVASSTPDMNVSVSEGFGWINGYYAKNDTPYPLALQAAHGSLNRIDAIVLRWVNESRSMELAVKTGTPASSPSAPELTRDVESYEIMLATVTLAAGTTAISQSMITDKRPDESVCGWVTGAVQQIDATNLFAQYNAAFNEWFEGVQSQLEGDVATNLLNRIINLENTKLSISDAATTAEITAGTATNKYITPAGLKVGMSEVDSLLDKYYWIHRSFSQSYIGVETVVTIGSGINKYAGMGDTVPYYNGYTVSSDGAINWYGKTSYTVPSGEHTNTWAKAVGAALLNKWVLCNDNTVLKILNQTNVTAGGSSGLIRIYNTSCGTVQTQLTGTTGNYTLLSSTSSDTYPSVSDAYNIWIPFLPPRGTIPTAYGIDCFRYVGNGTGKVLTFERPVKYIEIYRVGTAENFKLFPPLGIYVRNDAIKTENFTNSGGFISSDGKTITITGLDTYLYSNGVKYYGLALY